MSSRERRLLDRDIEIRKLQGELKHYKTCFFSCVFEKDRTRKALDIALDWLGQVATLEKCDDDLCREFTKRKLAEIRTILEQKDN